MATVKVEKNSYKVETLYQWDKDQELEIYGLSLASVPEVHFANVAMSRAIVRQASMDAAGVVRVEVPNSLLQKPHGIQVYICTYAGSTFETQYKLEIPVKVRPKPADYTLEDDPEVYSFNALENQVVNALAKCAEAEDDLDAAITAQKAAKAAYDNAKSDVDEAVMHAAQTVLQTMVAGDIGAYSKEEVLTDAVRALFGLSAGVVPNEALRTIGRFHKNLANEYLFALGTGSIAVGAQETKEIAVDMNHVYIGDSVSIVDGAVVINETDDFETYVYDGKIEELSALLAGKYCRWDYPDGVYKFYSATSAEDGYAMSAVVAPVTVETGYTYFNSPDPNAYPESEGYLNLGRVGEGARIATGSYAGTEKYGSSNKNTLTFDFVPKLVVVVGAGDCCWLINPCTTAATTVESSNMAHYRLTVAWTGKSVSWYAAEANNGHDQLNGTSTTYYYIAIG